PPCERDRAGPGDGDRRPLLVALARRPALHRTRPVRAAVARCGHEHAVVAGTPALIRDDAEVTADRERRVALRVGAAPYRARAREAGPRARAAEALRRRRPDRHVLPDDRLDVAVLARSGLGRIRALGAAAGRKLPADLAEALAALGKGLLRVER